MPVMKRPSMKPPDLGDVSKDVKLGRDLPVSWNVSFTETKLV